MNGFQEKRAEVSQARRHFRSAGERLHYMRNRVAARANDLQATLRLGRAGANSAEPIRRELVQFKDILERDNASFLEAKLALGQKIFGLAELADPSKQIEEWDDRTPILLLPVRIESRFMDGDAGKELWVRIFPDDIATHTHEKDLTLDEIEDARAYWKEIALASAEADDDIRQAKEKGAWHALTSDQGGSRASWLMIQTRSELTAPETDAGEAYWVARAAAESEADEDLRKRAAQAAWLELSERFGPSRARWIAAHTGAALTVDEQTAGDTLWSAIIAIDPEADEDNRMLAEAAAWGSLRTENGGLRSGQIVLETKPADVPQGDTDDLVFRLLSRDSAAADSWSRAPRSNVMPDRFAVILQSGGTTVQTVIGAAVPDPLILGPDPGADELDLVQVDGDIVPGEDIAWMYDFEVAVRVGLGFKIPLSPPHDTEGYDRLLVLGLRFSADTEESRKLFEELVENHHHSPDGAGLVPQGTPTNNTEDAGSGFLSRGQDPAYSLATETGPALFDSTATSADKKDGQRLAEALGVDFDLIQHLEYAGQADIAEARIMNQALWPATLGHYLEQMLDVEPVAVREVERYFVDYVSGRGPLPALRIGEQPYGLLVASSFAAWKFPKVRPVGLMPGKKPVNQWIYDNLSRVLPIWQKALSEVAQVGKPGDPHENLLDMLGLHATSIDFHRRHAVGADFLYNYAQLVGNAAVAASTWRLQRGFAGEVLAELGWPTNVFPPILDLSYFKRQDHINDPLIDDVEQADDEILSEEMGIKAAYALEGMEGLKNYIGWLRHSDLPGIKAEEFVNEEGDSSGPPRPLLYRMLRHALLLANADAALRLYQDHGAITAAARKQVELPNIREERTITQWEYLDARVDRVLPAVSSDRVAMHTFVNSPEGLALPQASGLSQVRTALAALEGLSTARLERLFAEHVDICSYRLDAWQTALFTERLWHLRDPEGTGAPEDRATGLYLGAFGWLEDVLPATEPAVPVDPAIVPEDLREPELGPLSEQPEGGGFIHGPSINHAVAGAVLRNAYLTHADSEKQDLMAVDLSSKRVRLANGLLEGIRAGQPLGALLGYRFERGLKENHGDPSLAAYIPEFRNAYPLLADQITPDDDDESSELKEARNVFDGYTLLEQTFLSKTPLSYPYDVEGLPPNRSTQATAIVAEVDHMAWMLDAVKDLALSEGVYQVTQGNYDRAGAMVKAIAQGTHPPEPEILQTPRSGTVVNHRVAMHFDPEAVDHIWTDAASPRSKAEPALNAWLGDLLGDDAARIRYVVSHTTPAADPTAEPVRTEDVEKTLADLDIEPIDLIHIVGEGLPEGEAELLRRIRNAYRAAHPALSADEQASLEVTFPATHEKWPADHISLFAVMPLIAAIKHLVAGTRPLGANDYLLPSEATIGAEADSNPEGYDVADCKDRVVTAHDALSELVANGLTPPLDKANDPDLDLPEGDPDFVSLATRETRFTDLRSAVMAFAGFGFPDAVLDLGPIPAPDIDGKSSFGLAWDQLLDLAGSIKRQADTRLAEAHRLREFTDLSTDEANALTFSQKVERYRDAARQILGSGFNLLPRFTLSNPSEISSAQEFRNRALDQGLLRHSADPLIAEEWFQGAARVRDRLELLETINTLGDVFGNLASPIRPLQLPFRETDYWIAVEYPEVPVANLDDEDVFRPVGDFLSIAQTLPASGFDPAKKQTGLMIDAWTEVIPNRRETTGIAVHYNQPNSEPAQVLLLAITPELTGSWKWEDLTAILTDTLDRAKLRAVEPDQLGSSALAHFLPAILTPTTSNPNAAIATPLDYQTAVTYASFAATDQSG